MPKLLRGRWFALVVGTVLAVLALELTLQAGALVVWLAFGSHAPSAQHATSRVALCIGDSFTWGIGASQPDLSYPVQTERLLNATTGGVRWTVVNGGWPGQTSREVLLRLPDQLRACSPALVCVLVGHNDPWNLPDPVTSNSVAFPLAWRTGRLLALVKHALRPAPNTDALPFLGTWHADDGTEVHFEANGRLSTPTHTLSWRINADGGLEAQAGQRLLPLTYRRAGPALWLTCELWPEPKHLTPGPLPPPWREVIDGWRAWRAGDSAAAERGFLAGLSNPKLEVAARAGLVQVLAKAHPDRARAHLAELRRLVSAESSHAAQTYLTQALEAVGAVDEAVEVACRQLETDPAGFAGFELLARLGLTPAWLPRIEQALRAGLQRSAAARSEVRSRLMRALYFLLRERDPVEALRWSVAATLLDNWGGPLVEHLRTFRDRIDAATFADVVAQLDVPAEQRDRLQRLWERASQPSGDWVDVLRDHLRQIVACCRAAGAEPVLVEYPSLHPEHERVLQSLQQELQVRVVATTASFERAQAMHGADSLFVPDGHCSDAGYRLLAELVVAGTR